MRRVHDHRIFYFFSTKIVRVYPCSVRRCGGAEVGAPQPTMPDRSTVAVCFSGWQGRAVPDGGESIRRYLVRPLKADVLLALRLVKQVGADNVVSRLCPRCLLW